jgi:hypothetical protein
MLDILPSAPFSGEELTAAEYAAASAWISSFF